MNTLEINNILSELKPFVGTFASDNCPPIRRRPSGIIINTDPSKEGGEHWVALWLSQDGTGEYFDSFGFPPLVPQIQAYIDRECPHGFKYNNKTLQHPMSITCGPFSIAFIIAKSEGKEFHSFISKFSLNLEKNDSLLSELLKTWMPRRQRFKIEKKRASTRSRSRASALW